MPGVAQNKGDFVVISVFETKGKIYGDPLVTDDTTVVLGCHRKQVYFLDATGNKIKSVKTGGWVHAAPSQLQQLGVMIAMCITLIPTAIF